MNKRSLLLITYPVSLRIFVPPDTPLSVNVFITGGTGALVELDSSDHTSVCTHDDFHMGSVERGGEKESGGERGSEREGKAERE